MQYVVSISTLLKGLLTVMILKASSGSVIGIKTHDPSGFIISEWNQHTLYNNSLNYIKKTINPRHYNILQYNIVKTRSLYSSRPHIVNSKEFANRKKKIERRILEKNDKILIEDLLRKLPESNILEVKHRVQRKKIKKLDSKDVERGVTESKQKVEIDDTDIDDADTEDPTPLNHIKVGNCVSYKNEILMVTYTRHVTQARSKGHFKIKMKSFSTNKEMSYSFPDSAKLNVIKARKINCSYTGFNTSEGYSFEYEGGHMTIPKNTCITTVKYLKPQLKVTIAKWKDSIIGVYVPFHIDYRVVHVNPGNFAATLDNGLVVPVPSYIKEGDVVEINTNKGEFLRRASIA
ncbi:bifunctional Elongation factor P [Babesia duncani]|uniref:Bifunctional Elongation factor P n=1 Tax=Babesia duncani TaxID=323732 RepID=A0AAD9PHR2_9APIC|nr:bifunctional Elongation factor P [Babesia duncani]